MKHKNKILVMALALVVILPAVLFFSWLNASGEELGLSVEANLFSLADFDKGAMLSASCEAGIFWGWCQWSACSPDICGTPGTQVCEATSEGIALEGEYTALWLCNDPTAYEEHFGEEEDHARTCVNPACAGACGNGIIEIGESCDLGVANGICPSTCTSSCTTQACVAPPICGNGIVEAGESCDLGVANGICPSTCTSSCTIQLCGGGSCTCGDPANYCKSRSYADNCGNPCPELGTKQCGWQEVAP